MASKGKKTGLSISLLKGVVVGIFTLFILFIFSGKILFLLRQWDYFAVKDIWYESSLKSIEASELANLKGKNLFEIDLKKVQRQLQLRYPQFANLQVIKRFPNQILVVARQRTPFAQAKISARYVILDERGHALSSMGDPDGRLPLITGLRLPKGRMTIGSLIENEDLQVALGIIRVFRTERALVSYKISKIDVGNLSEIYFSLTESLKVIIDEENFRHKLRILALVLSQAKSELNTVKYIDLRFKEPILGKK